MNSHSAPQTSPSKTRESQRPTVDANTPNGSELSPASPHPRRWTLIRVIWVVAAVTAVVVFVTAMPRYIAELGRVCPTMDNCGLGQVTQSQLDALLAIGINLSAYTAFSVALSVLFAMTSFSVAGILFWRRSNDWVALLVGMLLLLLGTLNETSVLQERPGPWHWPSVIIGMCAFELLYLLFALFPDGHFTPRWTRWLAVGIIPSYIDTFVPLRDLPPALSMVISIVFVMGMWLALIGAQIYRYRVISTPVQRQQTKWVLFSVSLIVLLNVVNVLDQMLLSTWSGYALSSIITSIAFNLGTLTIPLAFAVAILRYRLYNIDIIIKRTLVYASLTVILAALYLSLVVGAQALIELVTGQQQRQPAVVIVISTLLIAALFQPLRHRIQDLIDQRFYRSRYDAVKTTERFAASLRQVVELDQIRDDLLVTIDETMKPVHISLWLTPSELEGSPK